jgi:hypothetical protein
VSSTVPIKLAAALPERRLHIVLVVPRGEAVRNFLYSDTLPTLAERARVSVLSMVRDEKLLAHARSYVEEILPLDNFRPPRMVGWLRALTENAHDKWLWSEVAKNNWELRDRRAREDGTRLRRAFVKGVAGALANRPMLRALTRAEQVASVRASSGRRHFEALLTRMRPDLVFNCSHIHGIAGELPLRVAHRLGITTAGFIFSWDNLTSRSRIFVPYDHYLVWHEGMKRQLLEIYPEIAAGNVHVTGTPQFDYHFKPEFLLSREELCGRIGIDPARPFVFYTAGIAHHFFEEHRHVEAVIRILRDVDLGVRPQLVVRTNIKDTSPEMLALAQAGHPDVVFPRPQWDFATLTPTYEDLSVYTSLLHHCALGINAASTVTLELLMLGKPAINLDFDPPGSRLPWCLGYERHIRFDHYRPVAESGAPMVARSVEDVRAMIRKGLSQGPADVVTRQDWVWHFFEGARFGHGGRMVADQLLLLAGNGASL